MRAEVMTLGTPNPRQREFLACEKKYVAFGGARGGGKSWAVRCKAKLLALRYAGIRILLVRRSLAELEANHLAFLTLEVRASNYPAIALYGSRGFRGMGRRKNYYEHPREDAIIMTKEFTDGTEDPDTGAAADGV